MAFSVLELSYLSLFPADMWLPSSKQCLEELSYISFLNYLYCMHHHLTPILHTHTHMLTAHWHIYFIGRVMEDTVTDTNIPACTEPFQNLLTEHLLLLPRSVAIYWKKSLVHNLVSLERTRKTDHWPIPILKLSSTFNPVDIPDTGSGGWVGKLKANDVRRVKPSKKSCYW